MVKPTGMEIVRRAYELWERAGKPNDRDQEFYLRAERELNGIAEPGEPPGAANAEPPDRGPVSAPPDRHIATILIAYDIHPAQGDSYDELGRAIQSLGAWWHHLETIWLVRTAHSPAAIRDRLRPYAGIDDQLLVVDITGDSAAWAGVSDAGSRWLQENVARTAAIGDP